MTFKTTPRDHQLRAWKLSAERKLFALLMEAGTGKTKIIIDTAAHLFLKGALDLVLVAAPNGVHQTWIEEIDKHMPDEVDYVSAAWGPRASDRGNFQQVMRWSRQADRRILRILTMNIEALSHKSGREVLEQATRTDCGSAMFVIDESHKIKTPGSARTKACVSIGQRCLYRRILTGTPLTKGYEDFYSQFKFLDWRIINCRTAAEFRARYCKMGGFEMRQIVGYRDVEDLLQRIATYSFEAQKKDCYDLPERTFITVNVPLGDEQRKIYDELKHDLLLAYSDSEKFEIAMAMTRAQRLEQIVSGYVHNPETQEDRCIEPNPRLSRLVDLVEEASSGKVLIWCQYRQNVRQICDTLQREKLPCLPFSGDVPSTKRLENLQRFKTDPSVVALALTRDTGGTGFTINEATTVINYSHDWKWDNREQSLARNHRDGQTHPVTVYDMVAPATVDVKKMKVLMQREDIAKSVKDLEDFRNYLKEI